MPRLTLIRHLAWAIAGLAGIYLLTSALGPYRDLQFATIAYTAIAAAGLTVLVGGSGQISLGQGAFMAVGAYTTAVLLEHRPEWHLAVAVLFATLAAAVTGGLVGVAAARLRGPYLAGATLAFAVGLPALADYRGLKDLLGGANGLVVATPPAPLSLGESFPLERWQAWITGGCLVITLFLLGNLQRSRMGRTMRAVRDDEIAAALSGVDVARTQVLAFVVSATCGGLGGALLAVVNGLAAPGAFPLALSLSLLTAVILGGLGSLAGAVYGAALLALLPTWSSDVAQSLHLSRNVYANLPLAIYGVVLVVVMIGFPYGIQGGLRRLVRWLHAEGSPRSRDGNSARADVTEVTNVPVTEPDSVLKGGPDGDQGEITGRSAHRAPRTRRGLRWQRGQQQ
jgi:branched-chain amino acid transport system permease protein